MAIPSTARRAVWNGREGRLRAPWRLLAGAVVVAVAGTAGVVLATQVERTAGGAAAAGAVARVVVLGALVAGVLAAARLVDRRRLRDLGLGASRAWWADLGFGLALGVALPGAVFGLELALGFVRVTGTLVTRPGPTLPAAPGLGFVPAFLLTAAYFVAVGLFEELLFRGYLLVNLAEGLCWFERADPVRALLAATGATSLLFGLGHLANPNASPVAALTIALFGVFLGAGYLVTGRLAVPVGVHVAWNLSLSSVFGFPVSGVATPATLVATEQVGPPLVTGGRFGPEAGLVSFAALAAGFGALGWWVRRREGAVRVREAIATPELRDGE